jgi:phage gp29-like protein
MEALLLVAALALGATAVTRGGGADSPIAESASLTRPRAFPREMPRGQDARDLPFYGSVIGHPGYAVTPQGVLSTFRTAEGGDPSIQCDLFDDLIENDSHLRNLFEQREQAVAGKPWVMQADGQEADAEEAARVLGEALRRLPMIEVFQHLLTFNRYGYACAEIDWGIATINGKPWIVPVWIAPVPARRFRIVTTPMLVNGNAGIDELRLYADIRRPHGDELRPGKWIVVRRSGTWVSRAGLMRTAAWPAMAKRFGFRDWLVYSQRFGLPLPIVDYPDEADDDDIAIAEEIVRKIGSDGGAVKPKSLELKFEDATRGNNENSKAHGGLIAHCNAEMSKLVNGSTLSNDNANSGGGASYGLGEVHDSVRWDNVVFDAERMSEAVRNQLSTPFMRFNALAGKPPLLKVQVVRDLDPKSRAEIADVLHNKLGIPVSTAQMRQELGFREPSGDGDAAPGATPVTPVTPAGVPS